MKAKDLIAILLIIVGVIFTVFPSYVKVGILQNVPDAEFVILIFMLWMTAIILYYLPNKN